MNTPTNNTHSNQPRPQQRLPIGTSDFLQLRREGLRYVDKSGLITEVVRASDRILLLPRPRRFGKTLALSTLAAYLERTAEGSPERAEREGFFQDLAVWRAGDDMRGHFGRYPTIFLSFKDVKERTWPDCRAGVARVLADLCERLEPTVGPHLSVVERRQFDDLLGLNHVRTSSLAHGSPFSSLWGARRARPSPINRASPPPAGSARLPVVGSPSCVGHVWISPRDGYGCGH